MVFGVVLIVLAMVIGEAIAPPMTQYAQLQKAHSLSQKISLNTDYGLWARDGQVFIHVRRVESDGRLTGIQLYNFDDKQALQSIVVAASAHHRGEDWQLEKVVQTDFLPEGAQKKTFKHLKTGVSRCCLYSTGVSLYLEIKGLY